MTLHLRPVTRGNLASRVIDGMLAGPGSEWHRDHAPRLRWPRSMTYMAGFYLRRGKPSSNSPFRGV